MKTIQLTILLLFFPLFFFGQTLTGLWTGDFNFDSTSVRKDQSFEIVLTQYKDKVYGFSRSEFIVNDTLYYIVKRVKGTIEGNTCEVKDDEIISYNFRGRLDKGVKMVSTFHLDPTDSTWKLDGKWKTNQTKKFLAATGKLDLKTEKDLTKSKIFPHLEELKVADDVAFYKESKKVSEPIASGKQPVNNPVKNEPVAKTEIKAPEKKQPQKSEPVAVTKPIEQKKEPISEPVTITKPVEQKKEPVSETIAVTKPVEQKKEPVTSEPKKQIPAVTTITENKKEDVVVSQPKSEPTATTTQPPGTIRRETITEEEMKRLEMQRVQQQNKLAVANPAEQKKEPVTQPIAATKTVEQKKPETISPPVATREKEKPITTAPKEIKVIDPTAAVAVAERKLAAPQVVNFKSDSLELALYDNGEVDGDTVSVLLNGQIILPKQGLKASAIKKTIYATGDEMTMVLYAENLGKYPPNTGLLIIHDGEETYQVRFSADLQQNAAVIFKRKRQ